MESDTVPHYQVLINNFENVIKNLSSDEIVNLCLTNSEFKFICDKRSTWIELLKREYGVDRLTMSDPRAEYIARKRYPPDMKITLKELLKWLSQQYPNKLVCYDGFRYRFITFDKTDEVIEFLDIRGNFIFNQDGIIQFDTFDYDAILLHLYILDTSFNRSFIVGDESRQGENFRGNEHYGEDENDLVISDLVISDGYDENDLVVQNVIYEVIVTLAEVFRMIPVFDDEIVYFNAYRYDEVQDDNVYTIQKCNYLDILRLFQDNSDNIEYINGVYQYLGRYNKLILPHDQRLLDYIQQNNIRITRDIQLNQE